MDDAIGHFHDAARGVAYPHTRGAQPRRDGVWGPIQALAVTSPLPWPRAATAPEEAGRTQSPSLKPSALKRGPFLAPVIDHISPFKFIRRCLPEAYGALWSDGVDNGDLFGRQAGRSHGKPCIYGLGQTVGRGKATGWG